MSFLLLAVRETLLGTPAPTILKIDPNPVQVGTAFEVVYSVANPSPNDAQVQIQFAGEGPKKVEAFTVPSQGSVTRTIGSTSLQPGSHEITLVVLEAIGTILVPIGPNGPIERRTRWGNPVTIKRSYSSFDSVHPPVRPRVSRIGPVEAPSPGNNSNAGVIGRLGGSLISLYAVSKHAGVWKSSNGGIWRQLPSAPKHAAVIATDPEDARHVVVGERVDDVPTLVGAEAGVWESTDGGDSWSRIYDPGLDSGLPAGQGGIRGVAFGPHGRTILIATARGVGVRASHPDLSDLSRGFEFSDSARGAIRELAVSENVAWALSSDAGGTLLTWRMDWPGWRDLNLIRPSTWPPWTSTVVPGTAPVSTDSSSEAPVRDVPTQGFGGLSAFDDRAFLAYNPTVGPTHPEAARDPACKPPASKSVCDIFHNRMAILSFDPFASAGSQWSGQLSKDNDGRGLGGRAFTYSVSLRCPALPATIGRGRRLYLMAGQSIQEARSMGTDGRFDWSAPVGRSNAIHSDFWDAYVDAGVCPPADFAVWLATDGGVTRGRISKEGGTSTSPNPQFEGTADGLEWAPASLRLETQNVHALSTVKREGEQFPNLFYATGDNDGWWGKPGGPWNGGGTAGDANGALTDGVTPWGIAYRGYSGGGGCGGSIVGDCAYAVAFGNAIEKSFNIGGRTVPFASATVFNFIPKLATEIQSSSTIHAVMLAQLPLMDATGNPIEGALGKDNPASRTAIIRTNDYAAHAGEFTTGWSVERDNIPPETERFWVGGGTANPRYYLFTPTATSCPSGLRGKDSSGPWGCLRQNLAFSNDEAAREARTGFTFMAANGPAFVNPYAPDFVLMTTLGASPILEYTPDGGSTFCSLPALTGLATRSGQLPLRGDDGQGRFDPRDRFTEIGSAYHGGILARVAQVAFDRSRPTHAIVITPGAGVYYGDFQLTAREQKAGVKCKEPVWIAVQTLSDNWGYPSTGALLDGRAYLGTEGNGVFQVNNPDAGLVATYFELAATFRPGAPLAVLRDSRGAVPWARYAFRVTGEVDNAARRATHPDEPQRIRQTEAATGRTDANGRVSIPDTTVVNQIFGLGVPLACELDFLGDGSHAPAHVRFPCTP